MKICHVLDCEDYDVAWLENLLEPFIQVNPGDRIFVKPNWVIDPWPGEEHNWKAYTTNGAVVEAVLRIIKKKIGGEGTVILGDAPMHRSNLKRILKLHGIPEMLDRICDDKFKVELVDLRSYYFKYVHNLCVNRINLPGDPRGTKVVQLGSDSLFKEKENKKWAYYDRVDNVSSFHNEQSNAYDISASILSCDVFINLPKLKTHKSAGITCALKNLVGTIGNKDCFPHRTIGYVKEGGDDTENSLSRKIDSKKGPRSFIRKLLKRKNPIINYALLPAYLAFHKIVGDKEKEQIGYDGGWYKNDTVWRGIVDLNRIILYGNKNGVMQEQPVRRYLCIADAIVAGEGFGPLHPTPRDFGRILVSDSAVALDRTAAMLIGFDYEKIPSIREAARDMRWPLIGVDESVIMEYNGKQVDLDSKEMLDYVVKKAFLPAPGWVGHIERETHHEE